MIIKERFIFEKIDKEYFKLILKRSGISSFTELAKLMNISSQYLSNVVNGEKSVTTDFFFKLKCIGVNLYVWEIFLDDNDLCQY